jgi:hypothetical protein
MQSLGQRLQVDSAQAREPIRGNRRAVDVIYHAAQISNRAAAVDDAWTFATD